jgi:hypothetical protein
MMIMMMVYHCLFKRTPLLTHVAPTLPADLRQLADVLLHAGAEELVACLIM